MSENKLQIRNSTVDFLVFTKDAHEEGIEVRVQDNSVWLTQKAISQLFDVDRSVVTKHLKKIFKSGELDENSVCAFFAQTADDGKTYRYKFYALPAIIAVGYRVNSQRATQFRQWATKVLDTFTRQGYVLDKSRLINGQIFDEDYFDHLISEIQEIRASERRFYQKITDIYATAVDYSLDSQITKDFFATVQNKMHYALIAFSELDYTDYRKVVRWLRDEHPLFEERIDIPVSDYEDFVGEAILLTPDLHEIDPVSGFVVTNILHWMLQIEDDGTAMFLLTSGQRILRALEEPLRVQNYLRNIMEITFDGTAGLTPTEQYEKLRATYADIARICDPAKLPRREEPLSIRLRSLMELWMLVLALYFDQDRQRICRCNYCWGYFIPKTKKATRYCDRVTDGQSCKQRGANLARLDKTSEDEALLIYKKLRDRMYSRLLRWIDAAPSERSNLIPMDYEQYDQWSENARLAREEYVQGNLTAEDFLRKIDTTHELTSYEAGKIDLPDGQSRWQQLVARDFRFDPERYFPEKMAHLNLSDPDPQWQILTADDLRRKAQKGHQSLNEKYGK